MKLMVFFFIIYCLFVVCDRILKKYRVILIIVISLKFLGVNILVVIKVLNKLRSFFSNLVDIENKMFEKKWFKIKVIFIEIVEFIM